MPGWPGRPSSPSPFNRRHGHVAGTQRSSFRNTWRFRCHNTGNAMYLFAMILSALSVPGAIREARQRLAAPCSRRRGTARRHGPQLPLSVFAERAGRTPGTRGRRPGGDRGVTLVAVISLGRAGRRRPGADAGRASLRRGRRAPGRVRPGPFWGPWSVGTRSRGGRMAVCSPEAGVRAGAAGGCDEKAGDRSGGA